MATVTPAELSQAANTWFRDAPALFRFKMRLRCLTTPFERLIKLTPEGASLLDVGGGSALFPVLLAHCGKRVRAVGFDQDPARAAVARLVALPMRECGSSLEYRQADITSEWPEGTFDIVAILDVLHHLPPRLYQPVIQTAAAKLNPGGALLYKDMCVRPLWRNWANRLHDLVSFGQWIHDVNPEQVERWAKAAGLTLERSERHNRYWYGHDIRVFRRE